MNDFPLLYEGPARRATVGSDGRGRPVAVVATADEHGDTLRVIRPTEPADAPAAAVTLARAESIQAAMVGLDARKRLTVVWTERAAVGDRLCWTREHAEGRWTHPSAVAAPTGAVLAPALARDARGRLWCAYQSNATGAHHIFITWLAGGEWAFPQRISDGDGNCFAPALCPFGEGVRVVWDGRIDGTYGVYMREMDASPDLSSREPVAVVAVADTLLANASIVALDHERSLVIYEKAQPRWGRRNRVGRAGREAMTKGNYLQARRNLHGAIIAPEGLAPLRGDINRAFNAAIPSPVRTRPLLSRDGSGGLWLAYRQILSLADADRETGFVTALSSYRNGRWTAPVVAPGSEGTSDMPVSAAPDPAGGLLLACVSRHDQHYAARIAATPAAGPAETPRTGEFEAMETADFAEARPVDRPTLGEPYASPMLFWGDLHRHSNLSDCRWWIEGPPADAYRYALAAAELDFVAVTDHMWNLASPDTRAELFDLANSYTAPGVFVAFCACEVSLAAGEGHLVILRDEADPPVPQPRTRAELLDQLAGTSAVAIPHHPGDPKYSYRWAGHDETIAPVGEIYQPYRTSFEAPGCPTPQTSTPWLDAGAKPLAESSFLAAWKAGLKLGVVASSDHLATGGAFAGVWADGLTRRDILDALRARRCYGATAKIELAFWADEHVMGESFATGAAATAFKVRCRAGGPIATIELLADGEVVHTFRPPAKKSRKSLTASRKLPVRPGEHFYYVRVRLADRNMAWSSPIWITGESPS